MQNALYRRSDVRGWRQPARGPMMFREKKALLHELQCSDVRGSENGVTEHRIPLFLGWCRFQLATAWKDEGGPGMQMILL